MDQKIPTPLAIMSIAMMASISAFLVQGVSIDKINKSLVPQVAAVTTSLTSSSPGDINKDGVVDFKDLMVATRAFGKRTGEKGFNASADVDSNGSVEPTDIMMIRRAYTNPALFYDLTGDKVVSTLDLRVIGGSFAKRAGEAGYNPIADVDSNGSVEPVDAGMVRRAYTDPKLYYGLQPNSKINYFDVVVIAKSFGKRAGEIGYNVIADVDSSGSVEPVDAGMVRRAYTNPAQFYDLTGDGVVGYPDLAIVAQHIGKRAGETGYNVIADVDSSGSVEPVDAGMVRRAYTKPELFYDLTGDGTVNYSDLVIISESFGKRAGEIGYSVIADVDSNGSIEPVDASMVRRAYTNAALVNDINGDGRVNYSDMILGNTMKGKRAGEVGYNVIADINSDGAIDDSDLIMVR